MKRVRSWLVVVAVGLTVQGEALESQAAVKRWSSSELWRVDGSESGEPFGDLRYAAVLPNGHLWLIDAKDEQIRRLDANGKLLGTVGRKGQGPGEFQHANGMAVRSSGEVWVNNPGNSRFDIFEFDGKLKRQITIPFKSRGWTWNGWFDAASGELRDPTSAQRGTMYVGVWRRVSPTGEVLGEIDIPGCANAGGAPPPSIRAETKAPRAANMYASYPFTTGGGSAVDSRRGTWCATPSSQRAALIRLGGKDTIASTSIDIAPVRVSSAERDTAIARMRAMVARYATNDFDAGKVPTHKPGIARLVVDVDGRLWIQHSAAAEEKSTTFDVHDAKGAHLARLTVPYVVEVARPMTARGNEVWMSVKDEDDVVSLVKLRIR